MKLDPAPKPSHRKGLQRRIGVVRQGTRTLWHVLHDVLVCGVDGKRLWDAFEQRVFAPGGGEPDVDRANFPSRWVFDDTRAVGIRQQLVTETHAERRHSVGSFTEVVRGVLHPRRELGYRKRGAR